VIDISLCGSVSDSACAVDSLTSKRGCMAHVVIDLPSCKAPFVMPKATRVTRRRMASDRAFGPQQLITKRASVCGLIALALSPLPCSPLVRRRLSKHFKVPFCISFCITTFLIYVRNAQPLLRRIPNLGGN